MLIRFFAYGMLGWCAEVVWTAVTERVSGRQRDWRMVGHTYLWMLPIYGLLAPLYEPLHDALRLQSFVLRGLVYMAGFWAVEFVAGYLLRALTGKCPWDYSSLRGGLGGGLIALEYGPVWFAFGLLLEPVHDRFVRLTPYLREALIH